ncbi:MnhB domain-containing protein [Chloroflexota bacterium]
MIKKHDSIIINLTCSAMVPLIQLFALYVVFHGHYGPGGGFQGGVLLGVSIILTRLYLGKEESYKKFPPRLAMALGAVGLLIYGLTGLIPMFFGGEFLNYAYLPIPWLHGAELRYYGILIVEIGIALGVFGTVVLIFDNLVGENW